MSKKRAGSKLLPSQLGRLDIRHLTDESDEDVARSRGADKNAMPVAPEKGRPSVVTIVWIRWIIPIRAISIPHRESKSDPDRYAGVRTRCRSKSESTCYQCN